MHSYLPLFSIMYEVCPINCQQYQSSSFRSLDSAVHASISRGEHAPASSDAGSFQTQHASHEKPSLIPSSLESRQVDKVTHGILSGTCSLFSHASRVYSLLGFESRVWSCRRDAGNFVYALVNFVALLACPAKSSNGLRKIRPLESSPAARPPSPFPCI